MSTYYDFTILAKRKDKEWETLSLQFNKDLLFGWELPIPYTEKAPNMDAATVFQTATTRTRYKFIDFIPKDLAFKMGDVADVKELGRYGPIGKAGAVLVDPDVLKNIAIENCPPADPKSVSIFIAENICRDHHKAWWIEANAWEEYLNKTQKEYEDRVGKLAEWNYIRQTLDFKKLTKSEKENIESEYGDVLNCYMDDQDHLAFYQDENPIDYYRNLVYNIITMDGLLKRFQSDYDEVYCAIYNSSSDNYLVGEEAETVIY